MGTFVLYRAVNNRYDPRLRDDLLMTGKKAHDLTGTASRFPPMTFQVPVAMKERAH